jgi:hypothetical protein
MGGKPPGVSNIVKMIKNGFSEFEETMGRKVSVEHLLPGVERLSSEKPI